MQAIPLPEIVIAVVVITILAVARQLWGIRPFPFVPRPSDLRPRQPPVTNEQLRARMIASEVILAIVSLPLILRVVPPNGIYGFRTGATLSSRTAWYSANAFHGWALLIAAVIGTAVLIVLPNTSKRWTLWVAFVIPVSCAIAVSLAYLSLW
jgi:hypothetical protein